MESAVTVRIGRATPWPGDAGDGKTVIVGYLVVLTDEAGHRAVPVWLLHGDRAGGESLPRLIEEPGGVTVTAGVPEELGTRLLGAAGATVTGVDIEMTEADAGELTPETASARIEVGGRAGTRQVTARLGLGLAVAAATGAPIRLDGAVLERLAVAVAGDGAIAPILDRLPSGRRRTERGVSVAVGGAFTGTRARPRYEPRNLSFANGLERWELGFDPPDEPWQPGERDYTSAAEDGAAVLTAAVPRPAGSAVLVQTIFADDYRGRAVVFRGEIRTEAVAQQAELRLEVITRPRRVTAECGDRRWELRREHERPCVTVSGSSGWARRELTVMVGEDADFIRFGITLTGPGVVALRSPELDAGA